MASRSTASPRTARPSPGSTCGLRRSRSSSLRSTASGDDTRADDQVTLASVALAGESLESLDLTAAPLNGFLLEAILARRVPPQRLPAERLQLASLTAQRHSPSTAFPLNGFSGPDAIIDCAALESYFAGLDPAQDVTCENGTIADVCRVPTPTPTSSSGSRVSRSRICSHYSSMDPARCSRASASSTCSSG